jgi:hypothetical protein
MREFRVAFNEISQRKRDGKIRLAAWGTILLLIVATAIGILSAGSSYPHLNTALTWLAALIVMGAIVGAHSLAIRLGMEKAEGDMVFVLTDKDLVRKRSGWPDVKISFSEISALYERRGWFVVESVEPRRRIAIPNEVDGFASLRTELAKHSSVVVQPQRSPLRLISMLASFLCWGVVLFSKEPRLTQGAAAIAVVLLAWESIRLNRRLHQNPKRLFVWAWVGLGWVAAILVLYLRLLRG